MNIKKIDKLIQYALAVAVENDWENRSLGPIHIIKYLYLADLEFAKMNNGTTYTGLKWKFFRFGPWSEIVNNRIEPALIAIGAHKRIIESKSSDDFHRWEVNDVDLIDELEKEINFITSLAIKANVRKFGQDTESLLHHVYQTDPMLNAAPDDYLDFTRIPEKILLSSKDNSEEQLTKRQIKKRKEKINAIKLEFQRKLELKKKRIKESKQPLPQYDDLFFEGVKSLEKLAGEEVDLGKLTCSFSKDFWKSKARHDPDLC